MRQHDPFGTPACSKCGREIEPGLGFFREAAKPSRILCDTCMPPEHHAIGEALKRSMAERIAADLEARAASLRREALYLEYEGQDPPQSLQEQARELEEQATKIRRDGLR